MIFDAVNDITYRSAETVGRDRAEEGESTLFARSADEGGVTSREGFGTTMTEGRGNRNHFATAGATQNMPGRDGLATSYAMRREKKFAKGS